MSSGAKPRARRKHTLGAKRRQLRAEQQIDLLAHYLIKHWSDAIIDGGAVDVAIRLLERHRRGGGSS